MFRSSHITVSAQKYIQKQLHIFFQKQSPKNMFTVSAQNVLKIFHNLSMIMKKTSLMVIKPKAIHVPWPMVLFHRLHNPLMIVSVKDYLMFINRVNLMLLILKQHLLSVYHFTIKQAGLIIIKRKAFRNHTLFCAFAALFFHFFVYLSIRIHLCS